MYNVLFVYAMSVTENMLVLLKLHSLHGIAQFSLTAMIFFY